MRSAIFAAAQFAVAVGAVVASESWPRAGVAIMAGAFVVVLACARVSRA